MRTCLLFICLFVISIPSFTYAQTKSKNKDEVKVYVDCNAWCDMSYIKTEINYVDFVPDRFVANVYVLITSQSTGSGGNELILQFSGQENFKGMQDTLKFYRTSVETDAEYRDNLVRYLKIGLTRFIAQTSLAMKLNITAAGSKNETAVNATSQKADKWNSWVFNIGADGNINSDDFSKSHRWSMRISANRVTEKLKISLSANISENVRTIDYDGTKTKYVNSSSGLNATVVKSLNQHWSIGGFGYASRSTYSNYAVNIGLHPAIEFSFFPYKDAVKRSVTLFYRVGPSYNDYLDSGYYDKPENWLFQHSLSLNTGFIQKWGNVNFNANWDNYLNSFKLDSLNIKGRNVNTFSLGGNLEIRIVKGLSVYLYSYANFTKGIYPNISRKGLSREDLLTNIRQYATGKSIYMSLGINYRFGSIYNNVVNPRFNGSMF